MKLPAFSVSVPTQDKYFRLENINSPRILVRSVLDYDLVQKVSLVLHVQVGLRIQLLLFCTELSNVFQDTFNGSASNKPFFTSVASITVHVKDVDNRPPWFQPCSRTNLGTAKLCLSSGYKGRVNLTEKEVRAGPHRGRVGVAVLRVPLRNLLLFLRTERWYWSRDRSSQETETRTGVSRSATGS